MKILSHNEAVKVFFYELLYAEEKHFLWCCENREYLSPPRREALGAILALAED